MHIDDTRARRAERLLIPATFITSLGNNIQLIAAALLLVRAERTMLAVGWLFIAVAAPQAVLSPMFGRLADRVDRRLLWAGCDLASTAAALALPLGLAAGGPENTVIYAADFALAVAAALFVPTSSALIKERIRPARLRRFNANYEIAMQAGMLLSASVGGLAVQWFGAIPLFVFNAGTFLVSALCVLAIGRGSDGTAAVPAPAAAAAAAGTEPPETPEPAGIAGTAATLSPVRLILLYAQGNVVVTVFNALLPVLVIGELHRGSAVLGVVDAVGGTGFLVAAASYRAISRRAGDLRIATAGFLVCNAFLVVQPWFGLAGLLPGVLAGAWTFGQARIASRALLLVTAPPDRTGRVFGIANACGLAGTVAVMLGVATVTDRTSAGYGFLTLAAISTIAALPTVGIRLGGAHAPRPERRRPARTSAGYSEN